MAYRVCSSLTRDLTQASCIGSPQSATTPPGRAPPPTPPPNVFLKIYILKTGGSRDTPDGSVAKTLNSQASLMVQR